MSHANARMQCWILASKRKRLYQRRKSCQSDIVFLQGLSNAEPDKFDPNLPPIAYLNVKLVEKNS